MRLLYIVLFFVLFDFSSAMAVTGDDSVPGQSCSPDKAVRVSANPSGVGAYVLTCESGKWVATMTAQTPTHPDQVATKRYIDDHVATIETHSYSSPTRYTTEGNNLPILLTFVNPAVEGKIAASLCSWISSGQYVQGKITQKRSIHMGAASDSTGIYFRCEGECITGPSGSSYAWLDAVDFDAPWKYSNHPPGHFAVSANPGEAATNMCSSFFAGLRGTINVNGECLAGATATRTSSGSQTTPAYRSTSFVIQELVCWSY